MYRGQYSGCQSGPRNVSVTAPPVSPNIQLIHLLMAHLLLDLHGAQRATCSHELAPPSEDQMQNKTNSRGCSGAICAGCRRAHQISPAEGGCRRLPWGWILFLTLILFYLLCCQLQNQPLAALNMYGDGGKNLRRTTGKNEMTCCDLSLISSALPKRHRNRLMKCFDKIREANQQSGRWDLMEWTQ